MTDVPLAPSQRRTGRLLLVGAALLVAAALSLGVSPARAQSRPSGCASRLLVLAAFPAEIDRLLEELRQQPFERVVVDGRRYYVGSLRGNAVVLALSGIGPVNARKATADAFDRFSCGDRTAISGVVFSGVAGGDYIGNVAVPRRWTEDGEAWIPTDRAMLAVARRVAPAVSQRLGQDVALGDPACACLDPRMVNTVRLEHQPVVTIGGDGITEDVFGGRAFPCWPSGGDVFGCEPCQDQERPASDVERFATGMAPFLSPDFFLSYMTNPPAINEDYAAQDMESAAVASVAHEHDKPFIAFRGVSDGKGDPLMLPGFPFQFFAYRQVAADHAAEATLAFLDQWAQRGTSKRCALIGAKCSRP